MKIVDEKSLDLLRNAYVPRIKPACPMIAVGMGTCGIGNGADSVFDVFATALAGRTDIALKKTGCFGFCAREPLVMLFMPDMPVLLFSDFKPREAVRMLESIQSGKGIARLCRKACARIDDWDFRTSRVRFGTGFESVPLWNELPFFLGQEKIVLRDCGFVDPESIEDYIAVGGYAGLLRTVRMQPEQVVRMISESNLRGRGGAGYSVGKKWELMRLRKAPVKYMVCNADEGDPGAYMNRNEIESDPHMLIEGMAIGAFATGASQGIVYLRAEYPLAVKRLKKACEDARSAGLLGNGIFDSGFSFDIELVQGAGAFVCGEETALMASVEGKSGRASPRPPFPAEKGIGGAPTTINNVETLCNVPVVIARGAEEFRAIGIGASAGTKVFSLVGKVKNTGLVELPLGTDLDTIVYGMGEGTGNRKRIKAVQSGGPSGGCVPASLFKTAVDYESLASLGAIMGSGGMVVMDQDNCMVDTARYFTSFTAAESCGKCAPCREGLSQMRHILERITRGLGEEGDLALLEQLARYIKDSALCGLGQTAANPILTTLRYFREDYERHIRDKRCESGVCSDLYLALCENSCPIHMNIPAYLALLKEGRIEEAFESTLRENPLPGTIGRICHFHCQMRCRRDAVDEAVAQGEIHRYLADTMYKMGREKSIYRKLIAEKYPATGKHVAIVGAGPAGLTSAFYLTRLGHAVTVFDSHSEAGGILRWGIPAYRLPKNVLAKEIELIRSLGAHFALNTRVGIDLTLDDLKGQYDALLLCIGAGEDRPLNIPGEKLFGVVPGYEFLETLNGNKTPKPGREVVVIGGGNSAIDAARSALRLGAMVTVAYRRSKAEMPANPEEIAGAVDEGIVFAFMAAPTEVLPDDNGRVNGVRFMKMKSGRIDETGRRVPIPTGQTFDLPCETVIVAVGERVSAGAFKTAGISVDASGTIVADRFTLRTSDPHVWAAGDAVSGPATAAEAMGYAKRAVRSIDRELTGKDRFESLFQHFSYAMDIPKETGKTHGNHARRIPPEERKGNFQEIVLGYTGEQAYKEAARCLRCDVHERAACESDRTAGSKQGAFNGR